MYFRSASRSGFVASLTGGAWIEITLPSIEIPIVSVASLTGGAWIEICNASLVNPADSVASLTGGAWIEIHINLLSEDIG